MKKLPIILSIISTMLSILSVILAFAALNWIHINNQREVATELLLSAKIKCLEVFQIVFLLAQQLNLKPALNHPFGEVVNGA